MYKVNFEQLWQSNLSELFQAFERALQALNIDFYIIGALARDTWLTRNSIRALGTRDVDWAVLVDSETTFLELKEYLIEKEGFLSTQNPYTLIDKDNNQVDILPFGADTSLGIGIQSLVGFTPAEVNGLREVYNSGLEEVVFEKQFKFKVAKIESIVLLKLIAWDDRPEHRTKDIEDIGILLEHYYHLKLEHIYENYSDIFEGEDKSELEMGCIALGRDLRQLIQNNAGLCQRIEGILLRELNEQPISRQLVYKLPIYPQTLDQMKSLFNYLLDGLHAA